MRAYLEAFAMAVLVFILIVALVAFQRGSW